MLRNDSCVTDEMSASRGRETTLGFQLLQHLCGILGIGPSHSDPSMDIDQDLSMNLDLNPATELRLSALGDFLKAVAEAGVYEVTDTEGSSQTTWFCQLTGWLLTLPSRWGVMNVSRALFI